MARPILQDDLARDIRAMQRRITELERTSSKDYEQEGNYYVKLRPVDSALVPNGSIFLDQTDNQVKHKTTTGVIRIVQYV